MIGTHDFGNKIENSGKFQGHSVSVEMLIFNLD